TVSGVYDSETGMWKAEGDLTQTQKVAVLPDGVTSTDLEVFHDAAMGMLGGDFGGQGKIFSYRSMMQTSFYGKGVYLYDEENDEYDLEKVIPMRWGIYDMQIAYGNSFSGKPSGATAWTSKIGGYGPTQMQTPFFYLADITGNWQTDGTINGQLSGKYMTPLYLGVLSGPVYGLYTEGEISGSGGFIGQSVGTYNVTQKLAHSASWGENLYVWYSGEGGLFTDVGGQIDHAGFIRGILGGTEAPWSGASSFQAMGLFQTSVNGSTERKSYLWSDVIFGKVSRELTETPSAGGIYNGYSTALWRADNYTGAMRSIYLTPPDSAGKSNAGFLGGDQLNGSVYHLVQQTYDDGEYSDKYSAGLWESAGTNTLTASLPLVSGLDPANVLLAHGEVNASFLGSFGGAGLLTNDTAWGSFTFFMNQGASLPFGVYDLQLGGETGGVFSGRPTGTTAWNANLGGTLNFLATDTETKMETSIDNGYWIASAAGRLTTEGEMVGDVTDGIYMTKTQTGTLAGPFYGIYTETAIAQDGTKSGTWIGQSIGNYQGTPLNLMGDLNISSSFMYTRYDEGNPTHGWDDQSAMWGLLGSADLPWGSSHAFQAIGRYRNPNNRSLWWLETPSESSVESGNRTITTDGGVLLGDMLGVNHSNNTGEGIYAALFVRPDGSGGYKAGYLAYHLASLFYPGLTVDETATGMWSLRADRYDFYEQAISGVTPDDLHWDSEKLTDMGMVGKAAGDLAVDNFTSYKTSLTDQKWGFWSTTMADGVTTLPGDGWKATAGGAFHWGGNGFWMATLGGNAWADGKVLGRIDYRYLTTTNTGAFGNDLFGAYQWNKDTGYYDWQAASAGVYGGADTKHWEKPLSFVGPVVAVPVTITNRFYTGNYTYPEQWSNYSYNYDSGNTG
ncbi:MAG TPA: hypothetical protein PLC82_09085, partial [Smithellaceae bacterium]|nr:hypothetical protein [Smithellaceae bacterium]